MTDLAKAIAEVKSGIAYDDTLEIILNAVMSGELAIKSDAGGDTSAFTAPQPGEVPASSAPAQSGELIPLADHKLAVALMVERAVEEWQNVRVEGGVAVAALVAYSDRILTLADTDALAEVQALRQTIARLRRLDEGYGEVETAIIMADLDFDGNSNHSSPEDRLIASVERLKSRAEAAEAELAATQAKLAQGGVRVKPLVFSELQGGGCCGRPYSFQYLITQSHNGRFLCHWDDSWHNTLSEAQAHAQKDYQRAALEGAKP